MSVYLHYNRGAIRNRLMFRGYKLSNYEARNSRCQLAMFVARMIGVK